MSTIPPNGRKSFPPPPQLGLSASKNENIKEDIPQVELKKKTPFSELPQIPDSYTEPIKKLSIGDNGIKEEIENKQKETPPRIVSSSVVLGQKSLTEKSSISQKPERKRSVRSDNKKQTSTTVVAPPVADKPVKEKKPFLPVRKDKTANDKPAKEKKPFLPVRKDKTANDKPAKEKKVKPAKAKREIPKLDIKKLLVKLKPTKKFWIITGSGAATLILSTIAFFFISGTIVYKIDTVSMEPTIPSGASIVGVNTQQVANGDIVVFTNDNLEGWDAPEYVKRVIATEGDVISCCSSSNIILNGEAVLEPYIFASDLNDDFKEISVPAGYVFVAGDNRSESYDSRNLPGQLVPIDNIKSVAKYVVIGFDTIKSL